MTYQVKDWSIHFENDRSKERDRCSFVCVPNKQHGMGFSYVMAEPDGAMIYGIWQLILGACSQQKRPRNGWLTSNGERAGSPWGVDDLAVKFRRPVPEIQRAIIILTSAKVGWLIVIQDTDNKHVPINSLPTPDALPTDSLGMEGNGIERKGEKEAPDSPAHFPECRIPDWKEWWGICQVAGIPEWFAQKEFNRQMKRDDPWKDARIEIHVRDVKTWWERDGRQLTPPKGKFAPDPERKSIIEQDIEAEQRRTARVLAPQVDQAAEDRAFEDKAANTFKNMKSIPRT